MPEIELWLRIANYLCSFLLKVIASLVNFFDRANDYKKLVSIC